MVKETEYKSYWMQVCPYLIQNTKRDLSPVHINSVHLPQQENVKYLGLHLDRRLTWRKHNIERKQLGMTLTKLYWLPGQKSKLSKSNNILINKKTTSVALSP
jgi:hypothetical protein